MADLTVRAAERAIDLLFAIGSGEGGLTDLSRRTGLDKATTYRLLATLVKKGVAEFDPASQRYSLGLRLLEVRNTLTGQIQIRQSSLPVMLELRQATEETVGLYLLRDSYRVCIEEIESPHLVRHISEIGAPLPLHAGAGKAILAFLPDSTIEQAIQAGLQRFTEHTIVEPERLRAEIREIRRRGYSTSSEERGLGACSVAAPIFNRNGQVQASLAVSGPISRFTPESMARYVRFTLAAAGRISARRGYQGTSEPAADNRRT